MLILSILLGTLFVTKFKGNEQWLSLILYTYGYEWLTLPFFLLGNSRRPAQNYLCKLCSWVVVKWKSQPISYFWTSRKGYKLCIPTFIVKQLASLLLLKSSCPILFYDDSNGDFHYEDNYEEWHVFAIYFFFILLYTFLSMWYFLIWMSILNKLFISFQTFFMTLTK